MALALAIPGSNGTVAQTFQASGQQDPPTGSVTGTMQASGDLGSGTTTKQPNGMDSLYTIDFSNVPLGSGYTLTVTDGQGGMTQATGLTVGTPPSG
jgi:hypothetical protein